MNAMTGIDLYNLNILQKGRIMTANVRMDLNSNKTMMHTKTITLLKNIFFFKMEGPKITVKGETDLHTLAVIYPAHDTHFGMSVGDVINLVAGKNGFSNLNQLGLKTINGLELKRGIFLEFKQSPVVHLFTLKGRIQEESKLQ